MNGFPRLRRCMNSLDCLTNRAALGWVSTATLHEQFGLSYQQSSSGMGFHGYTACTVRTVSPTEQLWNVFPRLRCMNSFDCVTTEQLWDGWPWIRCMNSSDCLTNRAALGWVSTATLHEQFGLSYQQSSSGMGFHGYTACTVRTVSPTEQLWNVFPRLRCMNSFDCVTTEQLWDGWPWIRFIHSSDCLANREALEWVFTATLHVHY